MRLHFEINKRLVHLSDEGEGQCLVFLHGYLESLEIWDSFTHNISENFRIVFLDLPGHGESDELSENQTMEQLAEIVFLVLKKLGITKCFMIGHSMGGYVTLMFHKLYPEMLFGFSLFHSHPFADTDQIRTKRSREKEFVKEGRKNLIANMNIPNAFATDNLLKFANEVEKAKNIALKTSEKGIVACLNAMMKRADQSESLKKTRIPFLYVLGKKDNYIDYKMIMTKIELSGNSKLCILENSGHMGFIEEKEYLLETLKRFINNIIES